MKQITGWWTDTRGNVAAYGRLHLKLNQDAVVLSTNQVAPREVEFLLNANGALPASAKIWANDELSPSGTYYTLVVTAYGGGVIWGPAYAYLVGPSPININTITPSSIVPPIQLQATTTGGLTIQVPGVGTAFSQLMLVGGSNVTLTGQTDISGDMTLTINAAGVPGGGGQIRLQVFL